MWGLPWWLISKESASNAGEVGSIPGLGRCHGEGNGYPLQYFSLENPMDRGGAILCTVFGSTNCNFPSFGKQNISNSLVGCRVLQSLRPEVGLMSPFLYFPLPFLMLSWSSCVLPAILHDHSLDATSLPFFTGKCIIPFPPSGTCCSSTEWHLGTSTVALTWPHLCPWILLTRMGFSAPQRHMGRFTPCVWYPALFLCLLSLPECPVP